ncbi:MAG TPA: serine/threonine-protein kinase [Polyangiaceae bacterium]|nr:serine/threonine-protein kinase [Polyangiaceae bacterium]
MASSANAYNPTDPAPAVVTEASARGPEAGQGMDETRVEAASLVMEVPAPAPLPARGYTAYAPGVIVAQKFQLVRILGEGGMGSVWVAKNLALDVHVALKLIRSELAQNVPGLEERLLQEARAAASIEHPAVIKIFDFGMTELSDPYIAMELLHGESLGGTLKRRGKLNPVRAVQTLLPIVEALLAAHERGIVHRDLKPDNIFLARTGGNRLEPKVLDFGIAKFEQKNAPNLTSVGTVLGSPAYMSPEQARGEADVDGRTDVWALCVVLYEVITGNLPFAADNYNALLYAILEGQPKTFNELGISEPLLWSILSRGLEKNRDRRCADMFELGRGLAIWLLDRGVQEDVCNGLLRSKWLERPQRQAIADHHSFFPTDPPSADAARTVRSGEGGFELLPLDENGELSSGVRPAESTNQLFGVPYAGKTGQNATTQIKAPPPSRRRWIWFTIAGTLLSFSAAVGLQALSSSTTREEDEPTVAPQAFERRHPRIPAETTVESVVEMPRPLATAKPSAAPSAPPTHRAPVVEARTVEPRTVEPRAVETRIATQKPRVVAPKPARNDLKNPFR